MTSRVATLIVGGLASIALALIVSWFLANFEQVQEPVFVGLRGEARYNPLLAAERLYTELGIDADSTTGGIIPDQLPAWEDTLILADPMQTHTGPESRTLLDWVAAGGHLVYVAPAHSTGIVPPLLAQVGIRTFTADDPGRDDDDSTDTPQDDSAWTLSFHTDSRLEIDDPQAWNTLEDDRGYVVATREYEAGALSVLASAGPLSNGTIGLNDNADLAYALVTDPGEPGRVVLVFHRAVASLWQLIWRHAWPVVVGMALLLVAFLAARGQRFGPVRDPAPAQRRSLAEHVDACGTFLYRHDGTEALLASVRGMIVHSINRSRHGATHDGSHDTVALVARHCGRPQHEIAPLLNAPAGATRRDFVEQVRDLRNLWKSL